MVAALQAYAHSRGYTQKVVGDYAWAKFRTPLSEQNAIRMISTSRDGVVLFTEDGKQKTLTVDLSQEFPEHKTRNTPYEL